MTLGMFTDDFYPFFGGMGRYVYEITRRLPQENLLVFSPCNNAVSNHVQVKPFLNNKLRNLSFSVWLHQNIGHLIENYNLKRINIQCGPGGLFLIKKPSVPVIATCHHTYWQQSHYIRSQFWKRVFVPFEKRTYMCVERIICDSNDVRRILINQYRIRPERIVVIPIGVNKRQFCPISRVQKIPDSLLYVGRIAKRKGVDFLIKAMALVVKQNPNARLFIAGTGKGVSGLNKYIRKRGLENNVEFLGYVTENDLNELYNKVMCAVIPSMFEGFGLTTIEAMAAGTPVIATNVDSLREIVEHNVNGLLVEYGDIPMLAEQIVSLLGNENKRGLFIQSGQEKIKAIYNWDIILKDFMKEVCLGEFERSPI